MSVKTEIKVLDAAIEQISKRGGYTASGYQRTKAGVNLDRPGPQAYACCAIGGVEQAIWKITGEDIVSRFGRWVKPASWRRDLYANVVRRLNRKAKELYGCDDIEDVTFQAGERVTRRRVLAVYQAVRDELSA